VFNSASVVGAGRVGRAVVARLGEKIPTRSVGRDLDGADADLVLLCVPDRAIPEVAREIPVGPWIAHTSGAAPLTALDPHVRRFTLHPLQTFKAELGPEQLDGAWAAITADSEEGLAAARHLAELLGLQPFEVDDAERPLYHASAAFASAFLITLHEIAAELIASVGGPPEALEPLRRRTMENAPHHTGPLVRGDWETIERHLAVIGERRPDLLPLYNALVEAEAEFLAAGKR
jgi:predicted short-subunit dehydrogenase-like oxidoreductase (DUF2520 family)